MEKQGEKFAAATKAPPENPTFTPGRTFSFGFHAFNFVDGCMERCLIDESFIFRSHARQPRRRHQAAATFSPIHLTNSCQLFIFGKKPMKMQLNIELPAELERQLREQARQQGKALEQYVASLIKDRLGLRNTSAVALSAEETRLFELINKGFPDDFWQRLRALDQKRKRAILSEPERQELVELTAQLETANVERMAALAELAAIRDQDIDALMEELELSDGAHL
jgi:hypothetical protein